MPMTCGKPTAAEAIAAAPEMPGQGKRTDLQPRDVVTKLDRGNDTSYLAARLKRDHPDICERVEALLKDDPEALRLFREATTAPHGGDRKSESVLIKSDNVTIEVGPKRGNALAYTLDRLHREAPELLPVRPFQEGIAGPTDPKAQRDIGGFGCGFIRRFSGVFDLNVDTGTLYLLRRLATFFRGSRFLGHGKGILCGMRPV